MKIAACVRTLNEEKRIDKFILSYFDIADRILVADGGSSDNTVFIAKSFPRVEVKEFSERVEGEHGYWRNNDAKHIQFLIDWATNDGYDWIILDDCDMRPNFKLKQDGRSIIEGAKESIILVPKLYLWENDQHFPYMAKPGKGHDTYEPSLWAFRTSLGIKMVDKFPQYEFSYDGVNQIDFIRNEKCLMLEPPYCCLHFSWIDSKTANEHVEYYRKSGFIRDMLHPLDFAGPLEKRPDWARE